MKRINLLLLAGLIGLFVASCGGQAPQEITIRMTEFKFEPNTVQIKAGQEVRLTLINEGTLEHEFLVGRNAGEGFEIDLFDRDPSRVQIADGKDYHVGSAEDIAAEGYHVEIEPGGTVVMVFTVPADKAGEWEMGCFLQEGVHFTAGMKGTLTVEK